MADGNDRQISETLMEHFTLVWARLDSSLHPGIGGRKGPGLQNSERRVYALGKSAQPLQSRKVVRVAHPVEDF
jgi:hypothetical protein